MAGETQDNMWPLPKFYFIVKFGSLDNIASFQEISGLESEFQAIDYRHGDSSQFSSSKMPVNVTLKKGIFVKDNNFLKWYNAILMNNIKRETVTIQLTDEKGNPTIIWTLLNAWPSKITIPDIKSDAKKVVIETLELAHEGLTVANA